MIQRKYRFHPRRFLLQLTLSQTLLFTTYDGLPTQTFCTIECPEETHDALVVLLPISQRMPVSKDKSRIEYAAIVADRYLYRVRGVSLLRSNDFLSDSSHEAPENRYHIKLPLPLSRYAQAWHRWRNSGGCASCIWNPPNDGLLRSPVLDKDGVEKWILTAKWSQVADSRFPHHGMMTKIPKLRRKEDGKRPLVQRSPNSALSRG